MTINEAIRECKDHKWNAMLSLAGIWMIGPGDEEEVKDILGDDENFAKAVEKAIKIATRKEVEP